MRAIKKPYLTATLFAAAIGLSGCVASDLERAGIGALAGGVTARGTSAGHAATKNRDRVKARHREAETI